MSAGLVFPEASVLGLQPALLSQFCTGPPLCVLCVLISSYKDTSLLGSEPTHMTSFYPNYLFEGPMSGGVLRGPGGLGLRCMSLEGTELKRHGKEGHQIQPG